MWLKKHEVGGGFAIGPHSWDADNPVAEVPDHLGHDLLRLGGYEQVAAPQPAPKASPKATAPAAPAAKA